MTQFHHLSCGWLAHRLRGREWLLLGLFLLFFLGLRLGLNGDAVREPSLVEQPHHNDSAKISQLVQERATTQPDTFLGQE